MWLLGWECEVSVRSDALMFSCPQVGEENLGTLGTTPPASEVMAGAFAEEYEAEGKVAGAGEVVDEARRFSFATLLHWITTHNSLPLWRSRFLHLSNRFVFLALSGRYEYSQSFRDSQSSDGSVQVPTEFGTNMVYYYDDGNKVQMYTVDEKLLKEYIKRQM